MTFIMFVLEAKSIWAVCC